MFWADRIAGEVVARFGAKRPILIRDEKTVSGRVHVGSMRGAAIHGAVHEALGDAGAPSEFIWEHNDFDPMDDIPVYLDRAMYEEHLGKPLCNIPSPTPGYKSYGEFFAKEFQAVIEATGWHPRFTWASELYRSGKMDEVVREALEGAEAIRRIQKEVSGAERPAGWLPVSIICPECGKMTTTDATDFDGQTVQVNCYPTKVEYTKGCGYAGRISPFGGNAKLYWKADWPAKWKVYGVMVEGAGKDHYTKGGSRDVGRRIGEEVFKYPTPFDIPYEFFLVGGKKMSSSKGRGSSAKEIAALVPPKILRLALIGKEINQAFNFDPEGDTIPVLYDQYDKLAENYWAGTKDDYARLFEMLFPLTAEGEVAGQNKTAPQRTLLEKVLGSLRSTRPFSRSVPAPQKLPRFSQVAFVVQMPHLSLEKEFPEADRSELHERARYAKQWLAEYAPEKYVFKLQETMPHVHITNEQTSNLKQILNFLHSKTGATAEEIHSKLHELKAFKEIYLAFLGKDHGPKAGWFLASLPRDFVLKRLEEAGG